MFEQAKSQIFLLILILLVIDDGLGQNLSESSKSKDEDEVPDVTQRLDENTINRLRYMFHSSHQLARDQAREMSMKKTLKQLKEYMKGKNKQKDKDEDYDPYDNYGEYSNDYHYIDRHRDHGKNHNKHDKHKYELKFGGLDQPFARISRTNLGNEPNGLYHNSDYRYNDKKTKGSEIERFKVDEDMTPQVSSVPIPLSLLGSLSHNSTLHSDARQSSFLSSLHLPGSNPLNPNPLAGGLFQAPKLPTIPSLPHIPTIPTMPTLPAMPVMTPKPLQPKNSILGNNGGPMSLNNDNVVVVNVLSNW